MPTNPVISTGITGLIADSGAAAKIVLLMLFLASIFCWTIIFMKWRSIRRAMTQNAEFLTVFWHGKNIDEILGRIDKFNQSPVAAVFQAGVKEMKKLSNSVDATATPSERVENINRALVRAGTSEIAAYEKHVSWLATTASASPFIGLFGTVWGIMNSFHSIGVTGAANLAVVAPGISEALITTATGIAAAVPAVIAYNYFVNQIKRLSIDMDCFSQDFLNIIQRSLIAQSRTKGP